MDWVIIVILVVIVGLAVFSSVRHFKGQGGCCGGSSSKPEKKKLDGEKIAEKTITIDGMHCENCKNSVESHINRIEGAVAKVNLKKRTAVVSMSRMISDEELISAVESADFKVVKID